MVTHTVGGRHDPAAEAAKHNTKTLMVDVLTRPAAQRLPACRPTSFVSHLFPQDSRFSVHGAGESAGSRRGDEDALVDRGGVGHRSQFAAHTSGTRDSQLALLRVASIRRALHVVRMLRCARLWLLCKYKQVWRKSVAQMMYYLEDLASEEIGYTVPLNIIRSPRHGWCRVRRFFCRVCTSPILFGLAQNLKNGYTQCSRRPNGAHIPTLGACLVWTSLPCSAVQ